MIGFLEILGLALQAGNCSLAIIPVMMKDLTHLAEEQVTKHTALYISERMSGFPAVTYWLTNIHTQSSIIVIYLHVANMHPVKIQCIKPTMKPMQ